MTRRDLLKWAAGIAGYVGADALGLNLLAGLQKPEWYPWLDEEIPPAGPVDEVTDPDAVVSMVVVEGRGLAWRPAWADQPVPPEAAPVVVQVTRIPNGLLMLRVGCSAAGFGGWVAPTRESAIRGPVRAEVVHGRGVVRLIREPEWSRWADGRA